jgi:hypothetical protein
MHATIEKLLKAAFPVESMPEIYNKQQLQLQGRCERAVRQVGGWGEMAGSL